MTRTNAAAALKPSRARRAKWADEVPAPTETPSPQVPPEASSDAPAAPSGKIGALLALLRREGGATLADMTSATGWQAHSVRGALAGTIKKKLGLELTSAKLDGVRTYRIAA